MSKCVNVFMSVCVYVFVYVYMWTYEWMYVVLFLVLFYFYRCSPSYLSSLLSPKEFGYDCVGGHRGLVSDGVREMSVKMTYTHFRG